MTIIHVPATTHVGGRRPGIQDSSSVIPAQTHPGNAVVRELGRVLRVAVMGGLRALIAPDRPTPRILIVFDEPDAAWTFPRRGDIRDAAITQRLLTHDLIELAGPDLRRAVNGDLLDLHTVRVTEEGWRWLLRHADSAPGDGLGRMDTGQPPSVGARWSSVSWSGVRGAP